MSHSTVLVVIRDAISASDAEARLESLLAPFDENITLDSPIEVDLTDEEVGRATNYFREHPEHCDGSSGPSKPFDAFVGEGDLEAWTEWNRQAVGHRNGSGAEAGVYDADTNSYAYLSTYNPKSKWDWWTLGGRWHGFWQLKPGVRIGAEPMPEWRQRMGVVGDERVDGTAAIQDHDGTQDAILGLSGTFGDDPSENFEGRADLARKGDIDFDAMRTLAGQQADAEYDRFEAATSGIEPAPTWREYVTDRFEREGRLHPWAEGFQHSDEEGQKVMGECRTNFGQHPWITALREAGLGSFFGDAVEEWCVRTGGRETYVKRARAGATTTFAVLLDGEWHERGSMGWWGVVSDEKDPSEWSREHAKLIDSLPDDVFLAVVDVHI